MKKRVICGALTLCLALGLAGCGKKSEVQQAQEYYEQELGMDKEEAKELAEEMYGSEESGDTNAGGGEDATAKKVEMLPEIENGKISDCKVQVYDMVFSTDMTMTPEDVQRVIDESEAVKDPANGLEVEKDFDSDGNPRIRGISKNGYSFLSFIWSNIEKKSDSMGYRELGFYEDGKYLAGINIDIFSYSVNLPIYMTGMKTLDEIKTLDDALSYLQANGFVEVTDNSELPYNDEKNILLLVWEDEEGLDNSPFHEEDSVIKPKSPYNTSHFIRHGVQSITVYFVYPAAEAQESVYIEPNHGYPGRTYYNAQIYRVTEVEMGFDTDGNIQKYSYESQVGYGGEDVDIHSYAMRFINHTEYYTVFEGCSEEQDEE